MAPVEIEFGRRAEVQDQEIFIHDEVLEPLVIPRGKKKSKKFYAFESGNGLVRNGLAMRLEAECASDDNGGILKYKVDELKILRPNQCVDVGTLVIPNSGSVSRVISHPNEGSLRIGFRARHVKPEPESK